MKLKNRIFEIEVVKHLNRAGSSDLYESDLGQLCCTLLRLHRNLSVSAPTIRRHLQPLIDKGVVRAEHLGGVVVYSLVRGPVYVDENNNTFAKDLSGYQRSNLPINCAKPQLRKLLREKGVGNLNLKTQL